MNVSELALLILVWEAPNPHSHPILPTVFVCVGGRYTLLVSSHGLLHVHRAWRDCGLSPGSQSLGPVPVPLQEQPSTLWVGSLLDLSTELSLPVQDLAQSVGGLLRAFVLSLGLPRALILSSLVGLWPLRVAGRLGLASGTGSREVFQWPASLPDLPGPSIPRGG